jgi:hypothetical protein
MKFLNNGIHEITSTDPLSRLSLIRIPQTIWILYTWGRWCKKNQRNLGLTFNLHLFILEGSLCISTIHFHPDNIFIKDVFFYLCFCLKSRRREVHTLIPIKLLLTVASSHIDNTRQIILDMQAVNLQKENST